MAKNVGKIFEDQFKASVPDYCFLQRLNDSPQAFKQSNLTRFTPQTPFDYICFDTNSRTLWCLELKTTKNKSIGFEDINSDKDEQKMIHRHQILGLQKASKYKNVYSGFLFNFRDEINNMERTYFQEINDFDKMTKEINKKSFNELDLILYNAVKIIGEKKRVHYRWDIDDLLKKYK